MAKTETTAGIRLFSANISGTTAPVFDVIASPFATGSSYAVVPGSDLAHLLSFDMAGADNREAIVDFYAIGTVIINGQLLYIPIEIGSVNLTAGARKGDNTIIPNTQFFADTISLVSGDSRKILVNQSGANKIASVEVDASGYQLIVAPYCAQHSGGTAASSINGTVSRFG